MKTQQQVPTGVCVNSHISQCEQVALRSTKLFPFFQVDDVPSGLEKRNVKCEGTAGKLLYHCMTNRRWL